MSCVLVGNTIYTSEELTGKGVVIVGTSYDSALDIATLGDRYTMSFTFYILHRYYATIGDAEKAAYYSTMFNNEWYKVRRPVTAVVYSSIGTDL